MALNPMEVKEFQQAAILILHEFKFIDDSVNDWFSADIQRMYGRWGGDTKLNGMRSLDDAIREFRRKHFSDSVEVEEARKARFEVKKDRKNPLDIDGLAVTFTIPFGKGWLAFEAHGTPTLSPSWDELKEFYQELFKTTVAGYQEMRERPPSLSSPNIVPDYEPDDGDRTKSFKFDRIVMEVKGGQRYFKCKGEPFAAWGVRVWGEVLAKAGIDPALLVDAENFYSGIAFYSVKADGKAEKVIRITKDISL